MHDQLIRVWSGLDLEVRSGENGDGRTVCGICVPYDTPQEIPAERIVETFRRGVFGRADRDPQRVKMFAQHAHRNRPDALPVGRAMVLRDDARGLYGEFAVSRTVAGDEFLELIADGVIDQLSVGARQLAGGHSTKPIRGRAGWNEVVRTKCHLFEVSGVWSGAYGEAAPILAVRSADPHAPSERLAQAQRIREQLAAARLAVVGGA